MNPVWWTPFILVAGALQAFGAVMSAQLRISLSNPWLSLAVLFSLNFFFFAALFAMWPRPLPTLEGIQTMPWWAPLAGLTGAVAVFAGLALIDKLGAGIVNGLIITANLATSLAIDHFGLLNAPQHGANIWRMLGGVLMALGVALICRF
ncbi:MAG: DMT family transporter [Methylocystis sp.]|uniref:DMT family transporter n=1 Tax=Methylocystis sp. TaxID=1911079 RepID=UPI003DA51BEB